MKARHYKCIVAKLPARPKNQAEGAQEGQVPEMSSW
jgi:hypothetical protein